MWAARHHSRAIGLIIGTHLAFKESLRTALKLYAEILMKIQLQNNYHWNVRIRNITYTANIYSQTTASLQPNGCI